MAQRILDEALQVQYGPLVFREPHTDSTNNRGPHDDAGFVPLDSSADLAVITDTNGRSAQQIWSLQRSATSGCQSRAIRCCCRYETPPA